jgi:hypothetical protein
MLRTTRSSGMLAKKSQIKRWIDFRSRAEYSPESVYRHRTHNWEYIPVHPFGDEPEILARLNMQPEDCLQADAWWGIDEDATLLESSVIRISGGPARMFGKLSPDNSRVYLCAVFDAPFVTRVLFEAAMVRFAEAGFPGGKLFQFRRGDPARLLP